MCGGLHHRTTTSSQRPHSYIISESVFSIINFQSWKLLERCMEAFSHYLFVKFSRSTKNKFVIFHTIHLEKKQENMEDWKIARKICRKYGKKLPDNKEWPMACPFWKDRRSTLENTKVDVFRKPQIRRPAWINCYDAPLCLNILLVAVLGNTLRRMYKVSTRCDY